MEKSITAKMVNYIMLLQGKSSIVAEDVTTGTATGAVGFVSNVKYLNQTDRIKGNRFSFFTPVKTYHTKDK
jgi:hypothetical protein